MASKDVLAVKRLCPQAVLPRRADDGAAGYDIAASENFRVQPGCSVLVPTGLAMTVPQGTYGRLASRSGLAVSSGIDVAAGVVDASFTGEVKVLLRNLGSQALTGRVGDRVAQLVLEVIKTPAVEEVRDVKATDRGAAGFGSSGR